MDDDRGRVDVDKEVVAEEEDEVYGLFERRGACGWTASEGGGAGTLVGAGGETSRDCDTVGAEVEAEEAEAEEVEYEESVVLREGGRPSLGGLRFWKKSLISEERVSSVVATVLTATPTTPTDVGADMVVTVDALLKDLLLVNSIF
jgi:hypothetical protein